MPYINAANNDDSRVTLKIDTLDTAARNATSPYLYGLMHEDINHSGDGGIYAEMIANRAFQGKHEFINFSLLNAYISKVLLQTSEPSQAMKVALSSPVFRRTP